MTEIHEYEGPIDVSTGDRLGYLLKGFDTQVSVFGLLNSPVCLGPRTKNTDNSSDNSDIMVPDHNADKRKDSDSLNGVLRH